MSRHTKARGGAHGKEIRAWGVRRRTVDINQLALAYYLLARIRIEEQRQLETDAAASDPGAERSSEAA
jgi:ribosomal protein S6